jgi:hypothetical protein
MCTYDVVKPILGLRNERSYQKCNVEQTTMGNGRCSANVNSMVRYQRMVLIVRDDPANSGRRRAATSPNAAPRHGRPPSEVDLILVSKRKTRLPVVVPPMIPPARG